MLTLPQVFWKNIINIHAAAHDFAGQYMYAFGYTEKEARVDYYKRHRERFFNGT